MLSILTRLLQFVESFWLSIWSLLRLLLSMLKGVVEHTLVIPDAIDTLNESLIALPSGISAFAGAMIVLSVIMMILGRGKTN